MESLDSSFSTKSTSIKYNSDELIAHVRDLHFERVQVELPRVMYALICQFSVEEQ